MAKPRVFISSTYYDLKHIRSSLDVFIQSLGFDSVLSEKGDIAYAPDQPLDESCFREAQAADIFVIVIGGRYGSAASSERSSDIADSFFNRYESITRKEYKAALEEDIPIYILVEAGVYSEYQTFRRNRENESIDYAHVDSVNIFELLDDILIRKRNNPVQSFEKYLDIEVWLRDQWSGLFRELLHRRGGQSQLASLGKQVTEMSEVNRTLRTYIETIVSQLAPDTSKELIESENERLKTAKEEELLNELAVFSWLNLMTGIDGHDLVKAVRESKSSKELKKVLLEQTVSDFESFSGLFHKENPAFYELNLARDIMNLNRLKALDGLE